MACNADNQRVQKKALTMPTTRNYIWDDDNLLAEANATNTINVVYTNEPRLYGHLVSSRISGATSYHEFDALGSTRQLTNSAGSTTDTAISDGWGNSVKRTGATNASMLWIGELGYYFDAELAAYNVRRRAYEPLIARWTAVDPVISRRSPNRFTYASNAAVTSVDPSGLLDWFDVFVLITGGPLEFCALKRCRERDTVLVAMSPKGGETPRNRIVSMWSQEGWTLGKCGEFTWRNGWRMKDEAGDDGAYILQRVIGVLTVAVCREGTSDSGEPESIRFEFWETFPVPPGRFVSSKIDKWHAPNSGRCTKGSYTARATYGRVEGPIPSVFIPNNPKTPLAGPGGATDQDPEIELTGEATRSWESNWDCCPK